MFMNQLLDKSLAAGLIALVGIIWFSLYLAGGYFPGDEGDSLVIWAILERGDALAAGVPGLSNSFFPFRESGYFTEILPIPSFLYSTIRDFMGDPLKAYQSTFIVIVLLNVLIGYKGFRLGGFPPLAAFCFAFACCAGLPLVAADSHLHLFFNGGLVLTAAFLRRIMDGKTIINSLLFLLLSAAAASLFSVYVGVFAWCLVLLACFHIIVVDAKSLTMGDLLRPNILVLILALFTVLGLIVWLYHPYFSRLASVQGHRSYNVLENIALYDFFFSMRSSWAPFDQQFLGRAKLETQSWLGWGFWLVFISLYAGGAIRLTSHRKSSKILTSIILYFLFGALFVVFSASYFIKTLPVIQSMRHFSRFGVPVLCCIILLLTTFDYRIYRRNRALFNIICLLGISVLAIEISVSTVERSSLAELKNKYQCVTDVFENELGYPNEVLAFINADKRGRREYSIDAFVALQAEVYDRPTLNGFMSYEPLEYAGMSSCEAINIYWQKLLKADSGLFSYSLRCVSC